MRMWTVRPRRALAMMLVLSVVPVLLLLFHRSPNSCVLEYLSHTGPAKRGTRCSWLYKSGTHLSKRSTEKGGIRHSPVKGVRVVNELHSRDGAYAPTKPTHMKSALLTQTNKTAFNRAFSPRNTTTANRNSTTANRNSTTANNKNSTTTANKDINTRLISLAKEVIAQNKGPLLLTIINMGYLPLTYNWLCHTAKIPNVHETIVFLVQGAAAEAELKSRWPNVKTITVHTAENELDKPLQFGTVGYVRMMIRRTELLNSLIQANLSFVLFETDFIWFQNPVPDVISKGEKEDLDIVGTISTAPTQIMCGAFIYFRNTPRMRTLWAEVTRQIHVTEQNIKSKPDTAIAPVHHNEQVFLNKLLEKKYAGARYGLMGYHIVVDGKWYAMRREARQQLNPKVIHNNFLTTSRAKIRRFMAFNQWVLHGNLTCDKVKVGKLMFRGPR